MNKLNALEIENILDALIPLISEPKDEGFFRFVIGEKLESCSSGEAAIFINKLIGENRRR